MAGAEKRQTLDRELEEFRQLMEPPSTFQEGFTWASLFGALFIGLLMVPGAMYMQLMAGMGIGPAAQWVTVILFIEVARRAHKSLKGAEIFILFFLAGSVMGATQSFGLLWNQFFIQSDAAQKAGIAELLPSWFAPSPETSVSYDKRVFLHVDWLPVLGLMLFGTFFGELSSMVLGYGLFRIASDIERLPFPMAPIGAMGIMALADEQSEHEETSWRWRVFCIGGALGLAFGAIYLLLPTLSGAFTGQPIMILPIPFSDWTAKTQNFLPAVATGLNWDLSNLLTGMVMPFYGMLGSFIGLVITFIANPILYHLDILTTWAPGDSTIDTLYKNNIDFYFSFQIGIMIAIALAGLWQVVVSIRKSRKHSKQEMQLARPRVPEGRGDIKWWLIILCYFLVTTTYIVVSGFLIHWHRGVMIALLFFGFVYTPFISYVTARLEGMVGNMVEIPMIREACLILSGYRGVAVWFLPIPMANYGMMTVFYRQCELTGTKFTSIWKSRVILYPIILGFSILFANFIWSLNDVPSAVYPFAEKMWELQARNQCIMYSATLGEFSPFEDAFNAGYLGAGTAFGVVLFALMVNLKAPIFLVYGVVRGLGQTMPHAVIPQFIGALIGRFYFQKQMGLKWRQYIPVVVAGFSCGVGLITVLGVGITFLSKAVIQMPF
jgi:hypothetical protein